MSTGRLNNGERRASAHSAAPIDVTEPQPGLFRLRLRRGAVWSAIRIWNGPPLDPMTGEVMDRSWRWQATANERYIDFERVWPVCTKEPIAQSEYDYLLDLERWGKEHAPDGPQANPHRPVDLLKSPLPF